MSGRAVCIALALVLTVGSAVGAWAARPPEAATPEPGFAYKVRDRCLIENVNDVWAYRMYGEVTVNVCGETVTLKGIPEEYVRYSALCTRLP